MHKFFYTLIIFLTGISINAFGFDILEQIEDKQKMINEAIEKRDDLKKDHIKNDSIVEDSKITDLNFETSYDCKDNDNGDKISYLNFKFGENLIKANCKILKNLKEGTYYSLLSYDLKNDLNDTQDHDQFVNKFDITNNNLGLLERTIYKTFCEGGYISTKYTQDVIYTNLEDELSYANPNLKYQIYPIHLAGGIFTLELNFSFSLGYLLDNDYSLNKEVPSFDACYYDINGNIQKTKIFFPFRLNSIILYAPKDPYNLTLEDTYIFKNTNQENYYDISKIQHYDGFKSIGDKVFEKIDNVLRSKYEINNFNIEMTDVNKFVNFKDSFYNEMQGLPISCDGENFYFSEGDKSNLIYYRCGFDQNGIYIIYYSKEIIPNRKIISSPFVKDEIKVKEFEDMLSDKKINENIEKDSSSDL